MSKDSVINFILFIFIFLSSFNNINGQTGEDISISQCDGYDILTNEKCFNNVLIFFLHFQLYILYINYKIKRYNLKIIK